MSLLLGVLAASLLGSLHCAGMCGAFLAIAMGDPLAPRFQTQCAYHGGRLATYVGLGLVAGLAGQTLNLAGKLAGLQQIAGLLAAVTMLGFGCISLAGIFGLRVMPVLLPSGIRRLSKVGLDMAMKFSGPRRAWVIGLSTTLLPCGWLYAFVSVAAGTASPAKGAAAMATFWVGTLPVMVTLGAGVTALAGRLSRYVPAITCLFLIGLSGWTLVNRMQLLPSTLMGKTSPAVVMGGLTPTGDHVAAAPACCEAGSSK